MFFRLIRRPAGIRFLTGWVLAALAILHCRTTTACDTPVYRYAMYNWSRSPYRVYYLHRGGEGLANRDVNRAMLELTESPLVNVEYIPVDVSQTDAFEDLPAVVKQARKERQEERLPLHLVFSPYGALLHVGRLDMPAVRGLVDSPLRRELAEQLSAGRNGVLLFLEGSDATRNATALGEIRKAIQKASEGINVPSVPGNLAAQIPGEETISDTPRREKPDVGLVTLSPDDPKEQWFVRSLSAVESLEPGDEGQPMVFAIYGRGRAMAPYIGAGITSENLVGEIAFINGACSCEVKEQNPGMDLLTSWDWESAAGELAAKFGAETGNERLLELALLGLGPAESENRPDAAEPRKLESDRAKTQTEPGLSTPETSSTDSGPPHSRTTSIQSETDGPKGRDGQPASNATEARATTHTLAGRLLTTLGVVMGVGIVVVIGASILVFRRS